MQGPIGEVPLVIARRLRTIGLTPLKENTKKSCVALHVQAMLWQNHDQPSPKTVYGVAQSFLQVFQDLDVKSAAAPLKNYPNNPNDLGVQWVQKAYGLVVGSRPFKQVVLKLGLDVVRQPTVLQALQHANVLRGLEVVGVFKLLHECAHQGLLQAFLRLERQQLLDLRKFLDEVLAPPHDSTRNSTIHGRASSTSLHKSAQKNMRCTKTSTLRGKLVRAHDHALGATLSFREQSARPINP